MATADLRDRVRRVAELATRAGNAVRPVILRRLPWLAFVPVFALVVAALVAGLLGWLLAGSVRTSVLFGAALWLALVLAGTALVVLVDVKPTRRVTLPVLLAVAVLLLCGLPVGSFFTFAVRYGPTGAENPGSAVTSYFLTGPMGGFDGFGRTEDNVEFDRVLCADRLDALHAQADAFAADLNRPRVLRIATEDDRVTIDGNRATVVSQVRVSFRGTEPGSMITIHGPAVPWTFQLIEDDGWRVCQVDAPPVCGSLVNCDPDSEPTASPSPSPSDDPLGSVREMLPCGPRDPFPELRRPGECASASPSAPPTPAVSPT